MIDEGMEEVTLTYTVGDATALEARAIIEVRRQLDKQLVPRDLHDAIDNLVDEAIGAIHLTDDDVDNYR